MAKACFFYSPKAITAVEKRKLICFSAGNNEIWMLQWP
jgi:hypothetical protein